MTNVNGEVSLLETPVDGMVFYCDGSFRRKKGGWGIHAYGFTSTPLKKGIGVKQLPTKEGYLKVDMENTVTPAFYYDSWGHLGHEATNNTAELRAMIECFKLILEHHWDVSIIYTDSEYVRKGITSWIKNWQKRNWKTSEGNDVANKDLWIELLTLENALLSNLNVKPRIEWTKGHAGHVGNEAADQAARSGSGTDSSFYAYVSSPEGYHKPTVDVSDLILKKWLLFDVSQDDVIDDGFHYYHMFNLGTSNNYGHKKEDSLRVRHAKVATLFGRRMSDATFVVSRTKDPIVEIDAIKQVHRNVFKRDIVELGIACLDVALKPNVFTAINKHQLNFLTAADVNRSLTTPADELVSITVSPPKMAKDGAALFNEVEQTLRDVANGVEKKGRHCKDITEYLFTTTEKGGKTTTKLKDTIKATTPFLNLPARFRDFEFDVRALLGIDLPSRNTLNRFATLSPTATLVTEAEGDECFRFAFVFTTTAGDTIYQSPYTRFLIPDNAKRLT